MLHHESPFAALITNMLHTYITYIKKQDKNSMMSWSTNFIIAIITQPKFLTALSPSSVVQC